jgi:hypothetical protein
MNIFAPINKSLGHLTFLVLPRSSFYFKFYIHSPPWLFPIIWHTPFWFLSCMLLIRVSHSKASCCGALKWKFFICQSTHGLDRVNQNNPMMTWFLKDEMTLNTTLLVWKPMVTSNAFISCVIGIDKRLRLLMISTDINVFFFTRTNLYCHIVFCQWNMLMRQKQ